jgi:pimeloyl-ACP methyl ester carboxylesterase
MLDVRNSEPSSNFSYIIHRTSYIYTYFCPMKITHPRIEYLQSNHIDRKIEPTPQEQKWQISLAQFTFQTLGRVFPKTMALVAFKIFATPRWRAKHTRTDAIIDSAKISNFPFREFNIKLYEWGNDADPIILLAHGWESRGTALRMFVKPLLTEGYKVVAFDAIGHGDSSGKRNNLSTNAKTIAAIIQYFGGIYGAIGHSFGCSSLVYTLQYADNSLSLEKLVLLAVPPKMTLIIDSLFTRLKVPEGVKTAFYQNTFEIYGRDITTVDTVTAHREVNVGQLLLIHDKADDITPLSTAEKVIDNWDNARLLVTEGYGHFRIAKNPDVVKKIVAFITQLSS